MTLLDGSFVSTTANGLDGYRVVQTYGVVRGIVVRSRGALGMVGVSLQRFLAATSRC